MKKRLKVGIIGCGAIGSTLAKNISKDFKGIISLVSLYDLDYKKAFNLSKLIASSPRLASKRINDAIKNTDLVIESSSASSCWDIAKRVIAKKKSLLVMSIGGLLGHFKELEKIARQNKVSVYLPSGAICGIDVLKAAELGRIKEVILTSRKHPKAFKNVSYVREKNINLGMIRRETTIFSGTAQKAVEKFPQNVNVAALLSLAGIGAKRTKVRIVASPKVIRNIHEIKIVSEAGMFFTRCENKLHPDNPKTSYLAALSALATLKQILFSVKIGT